MTTLVPGAPVTATVDVGGAPTAVQGTVRQLDGDLVLVDLRIPAGGDRGGEGLRRSPRRHRASSTPKTKHQTKHQAEWMFAEELTIVPPPDKPDGWLVYDKVYGVIPLHVQRRWSGGGSGDG